MSAKQENVNYCIMQLASSCQKNKGISSSSNFYKANDTTFYKNGRFPICKKCLKEYLYMDDDEINMDRLKIILRSFNLPFFENEWQSAVSDNKETIGVYFKNLSLNHKDKHWDDGSIVIKDIEENMEEADNELLMRWGSGFSNKELQWLENDYHEWTTHHDCAKLSVQRLVQMICIKELEIRNARKNGASTEKLEKSLRELMNDTNLTPKTMNAMNETESSKVYGMWIRDIEQTRPAEYFKDKKIYDDYDGIKDYFTRFILRPMKNLLTGSREFDKEFNVEDKD